MFKYNVWLAWKSLLRTSKLSALIIFGIAIGVGISTSAIGLYRFFSADPIPNKSDVLYNVRIDSWDPAAPAPHTGGVPTQLTYRDAKVLLDSDIPSQRAAMYKSNLYIFPKESERRPFVETVRLTSSDFFSLFEVPFLYGGAWDRRADADTEPVAVIDQALNDRLFGGGNSVGQTFRIAEQEFEVIGVLDTWQPKVKFYDMTQNPFQSLERLFIPFSFIESMEIATSGNSDGWMPHPSEGSFVERLYASETCFLQMWVQLDNAEQLASFQSFVDAYTNEQRALGRLQRPNDNRVTQVLDLIVELEAVPQETRAMAALALLFLLVCSLNLIGLFLGKFLARAPVVGIRRALGASRRSIFVQHIMESELIGLIGGAIGLGLAALQMSWMESQLQGSVGIQGFFDLDLQIVLVAVLLSLISGLVAGVYPAWRICRVAPAQHLKMQ